MVGGGMAVRRGARAGLERGGLEQGQQAVCRTSTIGGESRGAYTAARRWSWLVVARSTRSSSTTMISASPWLAVIGVLG